MVNTSPTQNKKELNFELNLMPVIDILTVCVCFLLMTVVWIQVGAIQAAQSMGGQKQTQSVNPPSVWTYLNHKGEVVLNLRDVPAREQFPRQLKIAGVHGQVDWNRVEATLARLEKSVPSVNMALVIPAEHVAYDDIVQVMSRLKKIGIRDVGITPL